MAGIAFEVTALPAGDTEGNGRICPDRQVVRLDPDPHGASAERQTELERIPALGKPRVEMERSPARPGSGEPKDQSLPDATHRCEVEAAGSRPGQVVEVEAGSEPQSGQGVCQATGSREERGMDRGRE